MDQAHDPSITAIDEEEYPPFEIASPDYMIIDDCTLIFDETDWRQDGYDFLITHNEHPPDETFWRQKIEEDMGLAVMMNKPVNMSYQEQYQTLASMNKLDAIRQGRLDYLIMTIAHFDYVDPWVTRNNYHFSEIDANRAAYYGQINVLEWANRNGIILDNITANNAARGGQINVLDWLYKRGIYPNGIALFYAMNAGNKDVMAWLLDHGMWPFNVEKIADDAMRKGNMAMLEMLSARGIFPSNKFRC